MRTLRRFSASSGCWRSGFTRTTRRRAMRRGFAQLHDAYTVLNDPEQRAAIRRSA